MGHASNLIFIVLLLGVFYVLLFLPQRRQQKSRAQMMQKVGPGAKILTASGIYAQIISIHGEVLVAKISDGVEVEMDQRAIVRVIEEAPGDFREEPDTLEEHSTTEASVQAQDDASSETTSTPKESTSEN